MSLTLHAGQGEAECCESCGARATITANESTWCASCHAAADDDHPATSMRPSLRLVQDRT